MVFVRKVMACVLVFMSAVLGNEINYNKLQWNEKKSLPAGKTQSKQFGLAGAFSGLVNDFVIVAGGSNFSENPLVERGRKMYHNDIFILDKNGDNGKLLDISLPKKMAHGASVTIPLEKKKGKKNSIVLFIGGETQDTEGKVTASNIIYLVSLAENGEVKLEENKFPNLPVTFVKGAAVLVGNNIYVIGGKLDDVATPDIYVIDYEKALKKPTETKWSKILSYPGVGREELIAVAQNNGSKGESAFFIFGGYGLENGKTVVFTDGYMYIPKNGRIEEKWKKTSDILPNKQNTAISVFGGNGFAIGANSIAIFGGYNKNVFENWLGKTPEERTLSHKQFFGQTPDKFNWNRQVLIYNAITDTWITLGEMPSATCGSAIIKTEKNDFLIVNGELMPGVRTDKVWAGHFVNKPSFGVVNWIVLAAYFMGMLLIGVYFMKRESGAADFMTGGGRIPWWAAGVSIFATMLSSLTFMAIPAMTLQGDWKIFTAAIMIFACVPIVTHFYLPFFRRLNITSAYEYLEARFNVIVRSVASFMFIIFMIARIGIVLYLPAVALSAVTGIDVLLSIIVIGIITIVYCALGGIEAVIWGDFVQGLVLVGGAVIVLIVLIFSTEGSVIEIGLNAQKFDCLDFAFDWSQPTFWVILLGGLSNNIISYTSDQSVIQRYLTTKDEAGARKSIWLNGILSVPVSFVFYAIGSALYSFYKTNPEEMNVAIESANQIFPHYIMSELPMGIAGILIAAVFSATMSTLSSNINSAATAYTTDFYKRFLNRNADDHRCLKIVRIATVFVGVLGIICACAVYFSKNEQIFNSFNALIGLLVSGLGGLFAMGIFTKRISAAGALFGYVAAFIVLLAVNNKINGWFYGFIGLAVSISSAYLFSIFSPNRKNINKLTFSTINELKDK